MDGLAMNVYISPEDILYQYDEMLVGNRKSCATIVTDKKNKNLYTDAILKYCFERYLKWTPQQVLGLTKEIVDQFKLQAFITNRIIRPIELDEDDYSFVAWHLYPTKVRVPNVDDLCVKVYLEVISRKRVKYPKNFFDKADGERRAIICLHTMITEFLLPVFSLSKEGLYGYFADEPKIRRALSKYKLWDPAKNIFETPLAYLHEALQCNNSHCDVLYAKYQSLVDSGYFDPNREGSFRLGLSSKTNIYSWADLWGKYPNGLQDAKKNGARQEFIETSFELHEMQGFAKKFWSSRYDYSEYNKMPFKVLRRLTLKEVEKPENLPSWEIEVAGKVLIAKPEDIIEGEQINIERRRRSRGLDSVGAVTTWAEFFDKYPNGLNKEKSDERKLECLGIQYKLFEQQGFAREFWTTCCAGFDLNGRPFKVIRRMWDDELAWGALPAWEIEIEGVRLIASPDEVVYEEQFSEAWEVDFVPGEAPRSRARCRKKDGKKCYA